MHLGSLGWLRAVWGDRFSIGGSRPHGHVSAWPIPVNSDFPSDTTSQRGNECSQPADSTLCVGIHFLLHRIKVWRLPPLAHRGPPPVYALHICYSVPASAKAPAAVSGPLVALSSLELGIPDIHFLEALLGKRLQIDI